MTEQNVLLPRATASKARWPSAASLLKRPLARTIVHRLALGMFSLFVVSLIIFAAIAVLPGDFAKATLGRSATPETVAAFEKQLGLDRPLALRYLDWIGGAVRGDFGHSFSSGASKPRTVVSIIAPRLRNTLFLAGVTALFAVPLAIGLGLLTAVHRNSWLDRLVNMVTLIAISVPEFFVAYTLMLVLAVKYPLFYSLARLSPGMSWGETALRIGLPVLTLMMGTVAHMMRMTRASIIGLLASPYIEMARLKGIRPGRIVLWHALPNAWAPILSVIAFNLAYLIVGIVVVEVVFVFPGIGQAMVDAVRSRDIPVIQACALIFAATYIVLNLVADVLAIAANPRLLHPR